MSKQILTILVAALMVVTGATAITVSSADADAETIADDAATSTSTMVTDALGRTVTIPASLDNGIVTYGWWCAQMVSFFDAHTKVIEMDAAETQGAYGTLQPHMVVYDLTKIKTHTDESFTANQAEELNEKGVSLVIVRSDLYQNYKAAFDALNTAIPVVTLNLYALAGNGYTVGEDGTYHLDSTIVQALSILGDVLGEPNRDEEVVSAIDATFNDIRTHQMSSTTKYNLSGSEMMMCGGNWSIVFTFYSPYNLSGATNAAAGYLSKAVNGCYYDLGVEGFTSGYDFDVILYDPSNPGNLSSTDNQLILRYLYGLQGTENEVPIYMVLTTALVGFNIFNVMYDAYYLEYLMGSTTVTIDYAEKQMTSLYNTLWGDGSATKILSNLESYTLQKGSDNGQYTKLWDRLQIEDDNGTYKLVKYAGSSASDDDDDDSDDNTALYIVIAVIVIIIIACVAYYYMKKRSA